MRAQVPLFPDEIERIDVIAVERDGRDIFAFDSLTGRRAEIRLEIGEEVVFEASRGRLGIVMTNRRALGVAAGSGWKELRFRLQESAPTVALVEDRVAILVTSRRVIGFVSRGDWIVGNLSPHESTEAVRVGVSVGVVATNRRALGLAVDADRFVAADLQVKESLESVVAGDTLATVRTNRRILVFSGPAGIWTEQRRKIN
ncbi:MAG: hypothetical protein ABGX04_12355 [Myxococcales bacterium]|nr:hypothetical protein [Myxococcales bacterium]HIK86620.1 hypothetical protein [Myxococcales bacterium]